MRYLCRELKYKDMKNKQNTIANNKINALDQMRYRVHGAPISRAERRKFKRKINK